MVLVRVDSKKCTKCKKTKTLTDFYERSDRPGHRVAHCIKCKKEKYKEDYKNPHFRQEKINRSKEWQEENPLQARYLIAKSLATNPKRRQVREFSLSKEECVDLWSKGCHYCHRSILNNKGMGLDRKDNSLGYTLSNVLPCCGDCNKVRNTVLTVEEMKIAMMAVLTYRSSK